MLDAIAIDNEGETLLYECMMKLDDADLAFIIEHSVTHIQSEARWQIASLIGAMNKKEWEKYLYIFINDSDNYVQRRALISLSKINIDKAVCIAQEKIKDVDEYIRLVSLRILHEASFENLENIIKSLENDKFELIQKEIKEIKGITN